MRTSVTIANAHPADIGLSVRAENFTTTPFKGSWRDPETLYVHIEDGTQATLISLDVHERTLFLEDLTAMAELMGEQAIVVEYFGERYEALLVWTVDGRRERIG